MWFVCVCVVPAVQVLWRVLCHVSADHAFDVGGRLVPPVDNCIKQSEMMV